jgi:hypothetical protein
MVRVEEFQVQREGESNAGAQRSPIGH